MIEILICSLIVWFSVEMEKYYKESGNTSIEGFLEYVKEKYYTKH